MTKFCHFRALARPFLSLIIAVQMTGVAQAATQVSRCETIFAPKVRKGFVEAPNENLLLVEKHADRAIQEMANQLNLVQRFFFLRSVAQAKGIGMGSAGKQKGGHIYINIFNKSHPLGWISLVHESQHVIDDGPGTWFIGSYKSMLNPNSVVDTETNAFRREYDLLQDIAQDPNFDIEKALQRPAILNTNNLPYELDEPIWNDLDEPSDEFLRNPAKFLSKPGVRARLEKRFLEMADEKFRGQIWMATHLTKEDYVKQRLEDYQEKAVKYRKLAYLFWVNSTLLAGLPAFAVLCRFMGWEN